MMVPPRLLTLCLLLSSSLFPFTSVSAAAPTPVHIELALQEGGEGLAIFQTIAAAYEQAHPGIRIDLEADPRIADKLRVRILEKNFPEITNGDFGGWNLIHAGDVLPLETALAAPPLDGPGTWRDTFLPGTLDRYSEAGHVYAIPLSYYVQSIWFNRRMFADHGWSIPRTWDQLIALCQTIQSAGIPPFAFQGRYPYYAQMFTDGAYYQLAGPAAFLAQKHLEPGSFDNPQMIQALAWTQTLATKYFQPGAMGMGHTEAQLQFFLGHTAMIPCGSWLKSEMAGKIPDGFQLGTFNFPTAPGGKGDPTALLAASGYYSVFSHSKHPAEAVEFLRFLTSRRIAALFCHDRDIPVAIRGVNEANLSPDLADLATLIRDSHASYGEAPGEGFPTMAQNYEDTLLAVLTNRVTPTAAARQLETSAAAERFRAAHPDDLPTLHRFKPILLLALLALGLLYAASDAIRQRLRRTAPSSSPLPQRRMAKRHVLFFLGPSVLLFIAFALLPGVQSFFWSLLTWDGLTDAHFAGLRHFRYLLFQSDGFWIALGNNLFIMTVIPICLVPLSLFLAACVSRGVRGAKLFRSSFLLPSVLGGVATTILWMNLYDPQAGIVNAALVQLGNALHAIGLTTIGNYFRAFEGFAWLSQDHLYTALVPMSVWGGFGFNFILYLAAMEAVPTELYEAAELDGASPWQQFWVVTLPLIWEVLTISAVFLVIGGMKAFESIWLMTNQMPSTATHVIGTRMIQTMFSEMNVGEATALAVLLFAMVFVASLVAMRAMKRETVEL